MADVFPPDPDAPAPDASRRRRLRWTWTCTARRNARWRAHERASPRKLAEGTLISHLLELRNRLVRAVTVVLILVLPAAYFRNEIFDALAQPLIKQLPKGASLITTGVMTPFTTPFKLSIYVALFVAMPYVLYQIWAFVAPGLYRKEKRFAVPLLVSSIVLFYTGMAFAYQFVFPVLFKFFAGATPTGVQMMPDITSYMDWAMTMFLSFGVAFEVPMAVVLLALTGIVSRGEADQGARLRDHRHLRRRCHTHAAGSDFADADGRAHVAAV